MDHYCARDHVGEIAAMGIRNLLRQEHGKEVLIVIAVVSAVTLCAAVMAFWRDVERVHQETNMGHSASTDIPV